MSTPTHDTIIARLINESLDRLAAAERSANPDAAIAARAALNELLAAVPMMADHITTATRNRPILSDTKEIPMRIIISVLVILWPAIVAAQVPCATSASSVSRNPTRIAMQAPEMGQTWPDGSQKITTVEVGYFAQAGGLTGTPVATTTLQRAAFALAAGSTDCWVATQGTAPTGLAVGASYIAGVKLTGPGGTMAAFAPASNPFFWDGVPQPPAVIRMVRAVWSTLGSVPRLTRGFWRRSPTSNGDATRSPR